MVFATVVLTAAIAATIDGVPITVAALDAPVQAQVERIRDTLRATAVSGVERLIDEALGAESPSAPEEAAVSVTDEDVRRFRAAMDMSSDLVLLIDPVAIRYIDVNDTACRMLGYSREELLALGPHDIFSISREQLVDLQRAGDLDG